MKFSGLILILILPICSFGQKANTDILQIPLALNSGYGPFHSSLSSIGFETNEENNPWAKTYLEIKGIPQNWKNIKKGMIFLNAHQFVYQNYLKGNISSTRYKKIQQSWQWVPNKSKLSDNPIKCFVYVVTGENDAGEKWTIVDKNNNLDFGDDTAFVPAEFNPGTNMEDSLSANAIQVSYERLYKRRIIQNQIPLLIVNFGSSLWYNFPQYGIAYFNTSPSKHEIFVSPDEPSFSKSQIIMFNDTLISRKANQDLIISEGEYISIDNNVYKYRGVDFTNGILELEKIAANSHELYSTQVNFKAIPFWGSEFTSGDSISLDKYKGKFLFLDFWGTWCGPCLKEIPNIKNVYEKLDKSKVQILGIVGEDKATSLRKYIDKENILWPQILSDETNQIVESYRITGYPRSFLINPEGIIIAKNLRGDDLFKLLNELMSQ